MMSEPSNSSEARNTLPVPASTALLLSRSKTVEPCTIPAVPAGADDGDGVPQPWWKHRSAPTRSQRCQPARPRAWRSCREDCRKKESNKRRSRAPWLWQRRPVPVSCPSTRSLTTAGSQPVRAAKLTNSSGTNTRKPAAAARARPVPTPTSTLDIERWHGRHYTVQSAFCERPFTNCART